MMRSLVVLLALACPAGAVAASAAPPTAARAAVTGTSGNDTLTGTAGDDVIRGKAGNDNIAAGTGNDNVVGGPGRDYVRGGIGGDLLQEPRADGDSLYGDEGNDRILSLGGGFSIYINGGPGADTIEAKGNNGSNGAAITAGPGYDKVIVRGPANKPWTESPSFSVSLKDGTRDVLTCTGSANLNVLDRDRVDVVRGRCRRY